MSEREDLRAIRALLDAYIEGEAGETRTLSRIARVIYNDKDAA